MTQLFTLVADGHWRPAEHARGPFDGLQGGALAALMCAEAERLFPAGFMTTAIDAHYLRPMPLADIAVEVVPVQVGARVATAYVTLSTEGKLRARATITAMAPIAVPGLPERSLAAVSPETGSTRRMPQPHDRPWLMHRMDARVLDDGSLWFRFEDAVTGIESAFARALCSIDWLPGITRPDSWDRPIVRAAPNVDLSVRMQCHPVGGWIGLRGSAQWSSAGAGAAAASLHDQTGPIGFAVCGLVLLA